MTVANQPEWTQQLIDILDQQRDLYEQLHGLSDQQAQLVSTGDPDPLLALMSRRQQLIDQLTQVSSRLEPYRTNWSEYWAELDGDSRDRVGGLVKQVQTLLEQIMSQDERDRATLAARRTEVAGSVQRMRQGASVNRAYAQPTGKAVSRYTDRRG